MIKTANLTANTETSISGLGGAHCRINNNTAGTLYASAKSGIVPGGDNVTAIPAGRGDYVVGAQGTVYLLSASGGSVQVEGTDVLNRPFDNAAVTGGVAVGNPVIMDGLQGGVPFSDMVVSGKNLLKYPYYDTTKTVNGITFTDNGDGTITANGTATAAAIFTFSKKIALKNGTYSLSGCPKGGSTTTYAMQFAKSDWSLGIVDYGDGATKQFAEDINLTQCRILISSGQTVENIVFRPQLELGSTPTAYEPPITGRELTIHACGKNLLKYPYVQTTKTSCGITFIDNGDGSITASGTHDGGNARAHFGFSPWWTDNTMYGRMFLPKDKTITFKIKGLPNTYNCEMCVMKDNTSNDTITAVRAAGETVAKYTAEQDCYIACGIYGLPSSVGQTVNFTAYPQLELGDTATEYEPYHGSATTITPDTNPYTIPNDIRQQDGLNVVTASAGTLEVVGVRKNAAIKKIWDKLDELTTAVIVSTADLSE